MGSRLAVVVAVSGLLLVGVPALYFLTGYGCGAREDRLAEVMAAEAVLDAGPKGAERTESYRECDDDDQSMVVGTEYRYGGSRESVLGHYWKAAQAYGWRPRATAGGEPVPGCFTKAVGGTTAYLSVEDPADGRLHVEIVADRAGSQWC